MEVFIMAFLDKLNKMAKVIEDKTADAIEFSNYSAAITAGENGFAMDIKKIGEFYYEFYVNGGTVEPNILAVLQSAKAHQDSIAQAKADIEETTNLYDYWGDRLYHSVIDDSRTIINLASKEYSKCIERYLSDKDNYITITFCELSGDKLVTKGTYAKMARGEMVRFMAENNIENPVDIQKFDRLGYTFRGNLSSETEYVFERKVEK